MAFLKGAKSEVEVHITVEVEGDLGKKTRVPFKATYKKLPVSEAKDVLDKCRDGEMTDDDVIDQYLIGWRDLKGDGDEEVDFCLEAVQQAMQLREYRVALVEGFMVVQLGQKVVDAKN